MENIEQTIRELENEVKLIFSSDSSGHDIYHLKRTMNLALHIQEKEGGDKMIIALAAFLHDIHRTIQNETGRYCTPEESLPKVREILSKIGFDDADKTEKILHCIKFHEEYNFSDAGKTAEDIETLIVQDADNLDAIGAVGIARVFAYGGAHNIPIWEPEIKLDSKSNWDETKPASPSQIQHFYEKLLRLKDNMNTKTGKEMAAHRHKVMEDFLAGFFEEWDGKI
jgi:uncharacterized protein